MTGRRDFHTSVFDFATKVMTAVESHRGGSDRSSQVTVAIAFAGDEVITNITIVCTADQNTGHRRCVVVWGSRDSTEKLEDLEDLVGVRTRAGPETRPFDRNHSMQPTTI